MILRKRLGEILIENNLLTGEQLQRALVEQKKAGLKLGQYLIKQNMVKEDQIISVLCKQLKVARYSPDKFPVDSSLSSVVPFDLAQKYQLVPLNKKGRLLTLAMVDPLDINAMDHLESITNSEIEPTVCTELEFNNLLRSIYTSQAGLGGIMDNLEVSPEMEVERGDDGSDLQVSAVQVDAAPVIRLVNSILMNAVVEGASDVHLSPQQHSVQVRFRIDGKLHDMPAPPKNLFLPIVARIKILANLDITIARVPQDGRFTLRLEKKEINIRVSTVPTIYGENVVMRLLETSSGVLTLEQMGMASQDAERLLGMTQKPYGMILSTGPTGSGKTTSLYSILNVLNKPDIHIITLEDPVEYRISNIRQIQLNTKAGMTFASGLRAILRQDPDVIMVGEIRDAETASIAVRAAQTGHRLLSTAHTNNAAGTISRLIDMGIEPFLVSSVLLVSFAQRLLRTICPYCKEPHRPPEKALALWGLDKVEDANFQQGRGCHQCMNTGYKGRTGIFEVLVVDELVQDMILKDRTAQEISRELTSNGLMKTLRQDAARKVAAGITTLEEAQATVMV